MFELYIVNEIYNSDYCYPRDWHLVVAIEEGTMRLNGMHTCFYA